MGYVPNIPGVSDGFGGQNYLGQQYLNNFSNWGIGGSPDVPNIPMGEGVTQLVNPAVYANPNPAVAADGGSFFGDMWSSLNNVPWLNSKGVNGDETQGALSPAISGLTALGNGYLAMKQFGLAQDQFDFQKKAFEQNWAAKKATTNAQLEDRQRARVASNSGAYQSVGDYMNQYGIK